MLVKVDKVWMTRLSDVEAVAIHTISYTFKLCIRNHWTNELRRMKITQEIDILTKACEKDPLLATTPHACPIPIVASHFRLESFVLVVQRTILPGRIKKVFIQFIFVGQVRSWLSFSD